MILQVLCFTMNYIKYIDYYNGIDNNVLAEYCCCFFYAGSTEGICGMCVCYRIEVAGSGILFDKKVSVINRRGLRIDFNLSRKFVMICRGCTYMVVR